MNLKERQLIILNLLLNNNSNINIDYLAELFRVSTRTIYNDLNKIKDSLNLHNVQLEIDNYRNYYLIGDTTSVVVELNRQLLVNSAENRKLNIFKKLFLNGETISYNNLSEEWFISKTSIHTDINQYRSEISSYNLLIVSNNLGSYVTGEEQLIQQYCIDKINKYRNIPYSKFFENIIDFLKLFFDKELVIGVNKELVNLNNQLQKKIRESYFDSLLTSLLVLFHRNLHGFHLADEVKFMSSRIDNMAFYGFSSEFADKISKKFNINLSADEINLISNLFLAHGVELSLHETAISEENNILVTQSIEYMSEVLQIDFSSDKILRLSLLFHFVPMIQRLKMKIKINNPLIKELKSQYSIIFNATWYVFSTLMNQYNLSISEEEVSYLMVHFQASIERNLPSSRVLFISPSGIGISELAINRLKNILPRYVIVEHSSEYNFEVDEIDKFDLILSTIHVKIPEKEIIKVSPLIDDEDKAKILKYYADLENNNFIINKNIKFKNLGKIVDINTIYTKTKFESKNEAIHYIVDDFYSKGFITKDCLNSILERESMGDTALRNGVAIPHSNMETVIRSKVGIAVLNEPLNWGSSYVNLIFLICISKNDAHLVKKVLSDIEAIVDSKPIIETIIGINDNKKIYKYLFEDSNMEDLK